VLPWQTVGFDIDIADTTLSLAGKMREIRSLVKDKEQTSNEVRVNTKKGSRL